MKKLGRPKASTLNGHITIDAPEREKLFDSIKTCSGNIVVLNTLSVVLPNISTCNDIFLHKGCTLIANRLTECRDIYMEEGSRLVAHSLVSVKLFAKNEGKIFSQSLDQEKVPVPQPIIFNVQNSTGGNISATIFGNSAIARSRRGRPKKINI